MAAKQGFSAHLSQASEDAKRTLFFHRGAAASKSSWFSNLNTTCTIKSAPPRNPEVLQMLSTKSGFLYKRNEQHVWQARWCCVVPHMFLYYFDVASVVEPSSNNHHNNNNAASPDSVAPPPVSPQLQEEWNEAVRSGGRKTTAPRSSLNSIFHGATASAPTPAAISDDVNTSSASNGMPNASANGTGAPPTTATNTTATSTSAVPAGIIDLECYTNVHRSPTNPLILELAGDDSVNPDLRSFYFCANSPEHGDEWTQALLSERHTALVDECEAYRQVCNGFALQLQDLHEELDNSKKEITDRVEECYQIRSTQEEVRRQTLRLIQNALEREASSETPFAQPRRAYRTDLETVRQQHEMGLVVPAVQLLTDYTAVLEAMCVELQQKLQQEQEQSRRVQDGDSREKQSLETLLQQREDEFKHQIKSYEAKIQYLEQQLQYHQTSLKDAQQDITSSKMEFTMFQSSSKAKLKELNLHKKILKKEVINLRQKLDEVGSELSLVKHKSQTLQNEVEQERQKSKLLEKYVDRMESQVKVQQNMMELMSVHDATSRASNDGGGSNAFHRSGPPTEIMSSSNADKSEQTVPTLSRHNISANNDSGTPSSMSAQMQENSKTGGLNSPKDSLHHHATRRTSGSNFNNHHHHHHRHHDVVVVNTPSTMDEEEDDEDHHNDAHQQHRHHRRNDSHHETHSQILRKVMDEDNKSHMSELTEDRTQKHWEEAAESTSPSFRRTTTPKHRPPPSLIMEKQHPTLDTISTKAAATTSGVGTTTTNSTTATTATAMSITPSSLTQQQHLPPPPLSSSSASARRNDRTSKSEQPVSQQRLSVAQRARLEAERGSVTPVKLRMPPQRGGASPNHAMRSSTAANKGMSSSSPSSSFFNNMAKSFTEALDQTVFGLPDPTGESPRPSTNAHRYHHLGGGGSARGSPRASSSVGSEGQRNHHQLRRQNYGRRSLHDDSSTSSSDDSSRDESSSSEEESHRRHHRRHDDDDDDRDEDSYASEAENYQRRSVCALSDTGSAATSLSLAERQHMQRAQQIAFLKQQGLLKSTSDDNDDDKTLNSGTLSPAATAR